MKPSAMLFFIIAMIFLPSCDHEKNEPMSFDCVDKAREYVEDIQGYPIDPAEEDEVWEETEAQKEHVNKLYNERGHNEK